jgi:hypothetical protein
MKIEKNKKKLWNALEQTFNAIFDSPRHCIMEQKYHPLIEKCQKNGKNKGISE